jgi:hypothetical protein
MLDRGAWLAVLSAFVLARAHDGARSARQTGSPIPQERQP